MKFATLVLAFAAIAALAQTTPSRNHPLAGIPGTVIAEDAIEGAQLPQTGCPVKLLQASLELPPRYLPTDSRSASRPASPGSLSLSYLNASTKSIQIDRN